MVVKPVNNQNNTLPHNLKGAGFIKLENSKLRHQYNL